MLQKIIDTFEAECEKNTNDVTKRIICNHVVELLEGASEEVFKNIIDKKLTLGGAVDAMREVAEKIRQENCAVLSDSEGFEIVDKYFEINDFKATENTTQTINKKPVSLFDLM